MADVAFFSRVSIAYIAMLIYYATVEVNMRRVVEVQEHQIKAFSELVSNIITVSEDNTSEINTCIHKVNETHEIDPNIWSFKKMCQGPCSLIYRSICNLGDSEKYGVSYIALNERGSGARHPLK